MAFFFLIFLNWKIWTVKKDNFAVLVHVWHKLVGFKGPHYGLERLLVSHYGHGSLLGSHHGHGSLLGSHHELGSLLGSHHWHGSIMGSHYGLGSLRGSHHGHGSLLGSHHGHGSLLGSHHAQGSLLKYHQGLGSLLGSQHGSHSWAPHSKGSCISFFFFSFSLCEASLAVWETGLLRFLRRKKLISSFKWNAVSALQLRQSSHIPGLELGWWSRWIRCVNQVFPPFHQLMGPALGVLSGLKWGSGRERSSQVEC